MLINFDLTAISVNFDLTPIYAAQRSSTDARDLQAAAARDAEAIQKSMDGKDHGCSEAYRAAAKELIENTDFDAIIDNAIKDGIKRFNP